MMEKTLILKHISRMLCLLISYSKFTRTTERKALTHRKKRVSIKTQKECYRTATVRLSLWF